MSSGNRGALNSLGKINSKSQAPNHKQTLMTEIQNSKRYDLEERTFLFAEKTRDFVKKLPKTIANFEYGKQLIRSSGSQAANYIEANEALSKKDFVFRVRICRKEAKESCLWLNLIESANEGDIGSEQSGLITEVGELRKIFSSILDKSR